MNIYKKAFHFLKLRQTLTRSAVLMKVPVRMVHPRGYNDFYDDYSHKFHECNIALMNCKETDQFVYIFQRYGPGMTDTQKAYAFWYIAKQQLDKTPEFWSTILPEVKSQLATLDRNCVRSLYHIIEGAAAMNLQDNELWELVETKLVDERLHRYFDLEQISEVLVFMAHVGRGSDELIDMIEKTLIKHRKALTEDIVDNARKGFSMLNKGSEILFKVLDDPTVELPQLEA
jgi:hypothetical protein